MALGAKNVGLKSSSSSSSYFLCDFTQVTSDGQFVSSVDNDNLQMILW